MREGKGREGTADVHVDISEPTCFTNVMLSLPTLHLYIAGRRVAAIHDHANTDRTIGMGELVAVLNGIEFRTRHNDYKLKMPSRRMKTYGATDTIPLPQVPPEVCFFCQRYFWELFSRYYVDCKRV